jgi:arylsulfatase A-like enzyme
MRFRSNHSQRDASILLFANFFWVFSMMLWARHKNLRWPPAYHRLLPALIYQDLLFCAVVVWVFYFLLRLTRNKPFWHLLVASTGWALSIVIAVYTAINCIIYGFINTPLTYRLLVISDFSRGITETMTMVHTPALTLTIFMAGFVAIMGFLSWFLMPGVTSRLSNGFHSIPGTVVLILYITTAYLVSAHYAPYSLAAANPEWKFFTSLFESEQQPVHDKIPPAYYADFLPRPQPGIVQSTGIVPAIISSAGSASSRMNILMIVLESVGTRRIDLYGASYNNTPNIDRLAQHAMLFDRIYVEQPNTSSGMAALFCSVYPLHGWEDIPEAMPDIRITALPAILARHGYRTGFIHQGTLAFDKEDIFLRDHDFNEIESSPHEIAAPLDERLPSETAAWLQKDPSKPFFLAIWTHDTHHPYLTTSSRNFGVSDLSLNRYLNAVQDSDTVIGEIVRELDELKLTDRTLIVITGDHGEAFGEHHQTVHNFTVYDEEVHVPLILVNREMFSRQIRVDRLGRRMDIAPTILSLLGYRQPAEWQGISLFDQEGPARAYLFSADGNFTLGLIDGNYKYIYDFNRHRSELYDLVKDPAERSNLSADAVNADRVRSDHLRVEAWLAFQNKYLSRFSAKSERQ